MLCLDGAKLTIPSPDRIGLYEEKRLEGSIYDLTIENHSTLMNRDTMIYRIVD